MKSKMMILSGIVFFVYLINISFAALTASVDVSKSLTENEQATVTVTVTNTAGSSTETNIVTELSSSPSWFSVVTACTSLPSLGAGASQASTCIIKPTSTGSDLSLTATSTSQGGTSGSGSASGINVASQSSSLTASITADSSVSTSATFYVGTTVTAPSGNDVVNARATISRSGQCEIDTSTVPAQQSLGNVTKGTSKSPTNWKLTASSSSGTCTVTVNVVSDVGGTASPSKAITVTGTSGTGGTGGSAGSGGGGASTTDKTTVTVERGKATITIPSIAAGKMANVTINKTQDIAIGRVEITVKNSVNNIQIIVSKLNAVPASVVNEASGKVYHYVEITKANITNADINKTKINFKVEKSWIEENHIDEAMITLQRYLDSTDRWEKLSTTRSSSDSENVYYEAEFSGLSIFAISGEVKSGEVEQPTTEQTTEEKPSGIAEILPQNSSWILVILVVIVIAVILIFLRKRISKPQ
ncbi:MAG: PGF-pre-PGF domain-containing protein [Candidatus Aenigmarchaeota archaeon]|nr:PGF-pre-PGF domain-containing protein [Candidatus Aenigmarchaeota archaeon]